MCTNVSTSSLYSPSPTDNEFRLSEFEMHWNTRMLDASMEDWVKHLCQDNERGMRNMSSYPDIEFFTTSVIAEIVNVWCKQYELPLAVLYRTLEIYDNFVITYSKDLYFDRKASETSQESCHQEIAHWQEIFTEIKHRGLLYLVSCFQIASKLELSNRIVTVDIAATLLSQAHRPCNRSTITQAEIQVLVTLKYDVSYSPIIEYTETLICQLLLMDKTQSDRKMNPLLSYVDEMYGVAKMLLYVIYLDRKVLFRRIIEDLYGSDIQPNSKSYRRYMRKVQLNKMLMAAATICAASFLVQSTVSSNVMRNIYASVNIHPSDMAVISAIIISHVSYHIDPLS